MQLAERARSRFGWKVEAITFTAAAKADMAYKLRADFERKTLRIARDPELRNDLRALSRQITDDGNIRFGGESEGSHCDRFWAKALRQNAVRREGGIGATLG